MFELRLLGPVEVTDGGHVVDVGGARPIRVLTALAVAGRPLTLDELADRCFDDDERPDQATPAIRMAVRRVRAALGDDSIATRSGGYQLAPIPTDMERFEELIRTGRSSTDAVARASSLRRAVELWRGSPFGELGDLEWLNGERVRLEELHLSALEAWYDAQLKMGALTDVLPGLEGSVAENPLRDRLHRQLMLALYRSGRQAEALRVFQRYQSDLAEAGLNPPDETSALEQRIVEGDASLLLVDVEQRPLKGYRIIDRLGEGAFSVVYRATQPSIGRDVAIKQIRAELANRPEFIRRFEAEAHMVARLEHPHIVPLIDYWREPGSAYLVMRLLQGGSLESSVLEERWSVERTLAMVEQIGSALGAAHRAGIVHRDVKSANILLDQDGNAYLTDFGIALEAAETADPEAALSAGSPAYASPEQLRRERVGPSADVHGLAIALYETLTGRLPFPDEPNQAALLQRQLHDPIPLVRSIRQDVPSAIDGVLQRATAKDPADRYSTIAAFVDAFRESTEGSSAVSPRSSATTITADERNPYKGLLAFDEADSSDFAGRDRLVDQLAEVLDRERVVAVVGPSGSGKSSVVRAGLLPVLRNGHLIGSDDWFVVTILPGARPFEELEAGLTRIAADQPVGLLDLLQAGERGIGRAIRRVLPEHGQLLLVVDQFEELFTLCPDEGIRRQFLDGLASALTEERSRLRVVFTLRADFYDRPLRYESIGRLLRDATVPVLPLAADELERAIVDPASKVGCEFEPGLVSGIVADVSDQPGALPMLQYALTQLYESRISGLFTRDAYRELGGVTGALARRAEDLFESASPDERDALRRALGRLVTLGEGVEDTRLRALRSELGGSDASTAIIDRFGAARLLSFDRDPLTREPTVEVAHEALLREWPRLRTWLEEDRDDLRMMRHLTTAAGEWEASGHSDSELYRGGRLEGVEEWAAENPTEPAPLETAFLEASTARHVEDEERARRSQRRLRRLLVGVGVVAVVALIAGAVAFRQQRRADDQAALASSNAARAVTERIAADASALAGEDIPLSLLLAVETNLRDAGPVGLGALQETLTQAGSFLRLIDLPDVNGVRWLDNESMVAAGPNGVWIASRDGTTTKLTDAGVLEHTIAVGDGNVRTINIFDAAEDTIAFVRADQPSVVEVMSNTGQVIRRLEHESRVDATQLSSDGSVLLTLDLTGWLAATEVVSGQELWRVQAHPEESGAEIEWPEDGVEPFYGGPKPDTYPLNLRPQLIRLDEQNNRVATIEGGTLKLWSMQTGAAVGDPILLAPRGPDGPTVLRAVDDLQLSPDGSRFVYIAVLAIAGGSTGGADVGVLSTVETATAFYGTPKVDRLWWDGGETASVLFSDGRLGKVDWATGALISEINTGLTGVNDFAVSPDGSMVAFAGNEGLGMWSRVGDGLIASGIPREGTHAASLIGENTVATNYSLVRTMGWKEAVWWDDAGAVPVRLPTPRDENPPDWGLGFPWGDDAFLSFNFALKASLWDLATQQRVSTMQMPGSWAGQARSNNGALGAFGTTAAGGLTVFSLPGGEPVVVLTEPGNGATSMSFSPDDSVLATLGTEGSVYLYETETWQLLDAPTLDGEFVRALRFSPDGRFLVTMLDEGGVVLRDATNYEIVRTLLGPGRATVTDSNSFFFDTPGRYLITSADGAGRLWDLEEGVQVGASFPNAPDFRVGGQDGFELLTAVDDYILRWNLSFEEWPVIACDAAGRNMTLNEWEQFGPSGTPYRVTCPQWPAPRA